MDAHTAPPEQRIIRLRTSTFTKEGLAKMGHNSPTAMANAIGVSSSTLRRAIAGDTAPGEQLMAALLSATGRPFHELFVVTRADQ